MINIEIELKNKIKIDDLEIGIEKVYPALEDLEVTPTSQKQEFGHEGSYGYDKVVVNPISLQDKTVEPTKEQQIVVSDEGYSGLNQVTVNKIPSDYIIPEGTLEIDKNGTHNVKDYEQVDVNVSLESYEYAEFDPFNIMKVLDSDLEEYQAKLIILLANNGNNDYRINYADCFYNSGDLIKGSDGQTITVKGTQTYTFNEAKDVVNELGQKVRYFIVYKKTRTVNGNQVSWYKDILMYYFQNCDVSETGGSYVSAQNSVKAIEFDKDCLLQVKSQNLATGSDTLLNYKMPNNSTNINGSLSYAFANSNGIDKVKINMNEVTNLSQACYNSYSLKELELFNCTDETINCSQFFSGCYTLKKIVASPYLKPDNQSNFFYNINCLEELNGIDFVNFTSNIAINSRNLINIKNVKNISTNFSINDNEQLTHSSLINLLNALVDLTGQTSKKLTIGTVNLNKMTEEEKAIATNKNWTLS